MIDPVSSIKARYLRTLDAIAEAARRRNRGAGSVKLVVVTKTQPLETVRAAIEAGARLLGENYAEEAADKIAELGPLSGVEWHMIGHVQSRKAQLVAQHFSMVHSLDSLKLAGRLDKLAADAGRTLAVLLEFNVGGEASKHGWMAGDQAKWDALLPDVNAIAALTHVQVRGLMTMPPLSTDPEAGRPHFQKLRKLQEYMAKHVPQAQWGELSMGTSADYEVAVEEGATLVRIGQAILGPRPVREDA